ncbi:HNH endonuclease [Halobacillus rhizosphaerae]|uniref:HNH endonuclease n=1 Tax=Halobacillus rhizosphaerae TaxID=3064889 RepID=UPI00398AEE0D
MKKCNICNKVKSYSEFYKKKAKSVKKGEYIYYFPYCKNCTKYKSAKWQKDNPNKRKESLHKYNVSEKGRQHFYTYGKEYRKNGQYKAWQMKNKDKIKEYRKKRTENKKHEITDVEWENCLKYFKYKCAYCGISQNDSVKIYNQSLHKEHVIHDGENDLSNNVPACKSCNSSKWKHELDDWYASDNLNFSLERYEKILTWINIDYLEFIINPIRKED